MIDYIGSPNVPDRILLQIYIGKRILLVVRTLVTNLSHLRNAKKY